MKENILFSPITSSDHSAIQEIMKSLNKWFDADAISSILIDLNYQKGYVAKINEEYIGFITYFVYEGVGNIGWIGVLQKYHNRNIGEQLLQRIEYDFKKNNISTIQVYTLSDSVEYEPYNSTRAFYYSHGFTEYRRIKTNNPGCPEELYLRKRI